MTPTPTEALAAAVAIAGTQIAFQEATGMSQQRLSYGLKHGKSLPGEFVLKAEAATGVSRHLLRPDIYPLPAGENAPALPEVAAIRNPVSSNRRTLLHGARAA